MIGKTLAHYKITEKIGAGGMGEVYRATDSNLGREVAIKVLPAELSADPERIARFEREARTLATLQHPNVASVYGFEEDDGRRLLVMELVEGEDLAQRLERGPIPPEEAIELAQQIAEGLEAAHAKGIIHRDLKPANIKITPAGDAKILDFGLARAFTGEDEGSSLGATMQSPTISPSMTRAGVILGTAAYMSPEQARGRPVDKQTDIWSFGVVLFEMLTNERLFRGETVSDSIAAILHRDPDLSMLPPVPSRVRTLLRRCLERDQRQRLRDIGDARLELAEGASEDIEAGAPTAKPSRTPWIVASVMGAAALVLGWMAFLQESTPGLSLTTLGLPREAPIVFNSVFGWPSFDLSDDGTRVVYVGDSELYLRDINSFEAVKLDDTEDAALPAFTPDGRWVAYFANSKLWKIAVSGGAPVEICETVAGPGLCWGGNELFFSRSNGGGIWRVPASGGQPEALSTLDDDRDETSHRWPSLLPDGRHLLITIKTAHIASLDDAEIAILSLDTGSIEVLLKGGSYARYSPTGHLVFGRNRQLFAVPFDLGTLAVTGTPRPVVSDVHMAGVHGGAGYALSTTGALAYLPAAAAMNDVKLLWASRSGQTTPIDFIEGFPTETAVSPDGRFLASRVPAANDKIWVYDLQRRTSSRLTSTPGNDSDPIWSSDGKTIAYANDRAGPLDVFIVPSDGGAPARRLVTIDDGDHDDVPSSWSPDGTRLAITRYSPGGNADIWFIPTDVESEPVPFLRSRHSNGDAKFSPDGRWIAYTSDSSGKPNVYVRPYPGPGNPTRISTSEGWEPMWSPDGSELFYKTDDQLMAVSVEREGELRPGEPEELFTFDDAIRNVFDVMDGEHFLGIRFDSDQAKHYQIRLVLDWGERMRSGSHP